MGKGRLGTSWKIVGAHRKAEIGWHHKHHKTFNGMKAVEQCEQNIMQQSTGQRWRGQLAAEGRLSVAGMVK